MWFAMLVSKQSPQDMPTGILLFLSHLYRGIVEKSQCVYLTKFGTELLSRFWGLLTETVINLLLISVEVLKQLM